MSHVSRDTLPRKTPITGPPALVSVLHLGETPANFANYAGNQKLSFFVVGLFGVSDRGFALYNRN